MRSVLRLARLRGATLAAVVLVLAVALAAKSAAITPRNSAASAIPCAAATLVQTATGPVCGIVVNGDREWLVP